MKDTQKQTTNKSVEIIHYSPEYAADFKRLNYEWIQEYFELEASDHISLDNPNEKIIQTGGHIFMARDNDEIVGTCALIKINDDTYELAKMAVTKTAGGKGIGKLLGQAVIAKARELKAKTICLESNTILEPAIKLYKKLGFQEVFEKPSLYERCNIQMELKL